jgi:uncharacterized protein YcfJ
MEIRDARQIAAAAMNAEEPTRTHDVLSPTYLGDTEMNKAILTAGVVIAALSAPVYAQTAGPAAGATTGAVGGAIVGGPVGAAVGAVGGAIVGGIAEASQPRFQQYVVQQRVPSYTYREEVRVGAVLPEQGVRYYEVPDEFGATDYRYTVVNDRVVLVEPRTRRVVQIVD